MNTSRKSMEWLICFSIMNLMLRRLKLNNLMNLVPCQKQLECHQHILNLCLLRLYSFSHLDSSKPMKILVRTGAKGEPMTTPLIWL